MAGLSAVSPHARDEPPGSLDHDAADPSPVDAEDDDNDLIPDQVEDAADSLATTSRAARRKAAAAARAAGQARGQAGARIGELETAARTDDPRHWRVLLACVLAAIATAIDPPVLQATSSGAQEALRMDPDEAAQVISLLYVVQAGVMVIGGVLGDLRGLRRVLLVGLTGLLLASLLLATTASTTQLVLGHLGLSIFSSIVIPLSLASVMRTFAPKVMPVAIALYLSVQLIATLAAQPIAQFLYEQGGFAWTMATPILFTIMALLAGWRWLPRTASRDRMRLADALVMTLWSIGILAIVYSLTSVVAGWGTQHVALLVVGVGCLLATLSRIRSGRPRLDLPDLPFRVVGVTLLAGAALGLLQSGILLNMSTFLKGVQGYSSIASGIAIAPYAIATLVVALGVGVVLSRRSPGRLPDVTVLRRPIVAGLLITSASAGMLSFLQTDTPYGFIAVALTLLGIGASLANVPRTDLLFRSVEADRIGTAAGLNGSCFLLGGALGNVAVTSMIATTSATQWQEQLQATGLTADQAADAYKAASDAIFVATANPFAGSSYLDVAEQVPGWAAIFTDAYAAALVALCVLGSIVAVVAAIGLRRLPQVSTGDVTG